MKHKHSFRKLKTLGGSTRNFEKSKNSGISKTLINQSLSSSAPGSASFKTPQKTQSLFGQPSSATADHSLPSTKNKMSSFAKDEFGSPLPFNEDQVAKFSQIEALQQMKMRRQLAENGKSKQKLKPLEKINCIIDTGNAIIKGKRTIFK